MTWLFSKALMEDYENSRCSLAQEGESSEATCSDGEPCAQLNVMPTPHKFWRNDKTMEFSDLSRFGLTLRLLTESHGEAVLTWFLEASPARTLVQQEKVQELAANDQDYGATWNGSFAKWNQDSSSWKTRQCSLLGGLEEFSQTWPNWGSMQNGECWEQTPPAWITNAKESGLWPTPTATDGKGSPLPETVKKRASKSSRGVRLPEEMTKRGLLPGGVSNPEFSEWLMGWPLEWSDIKPLGMDKFHAFVRQHGEFLANEN
jgi:hypothetical protein